MSDLGYVFQKTSPGNDNIVILNTRQSLVQPFEATNWLDLRVGFFLSVCAATVGSGDDTITGLSETITSPPLLPWNDRYAIGLTDSLTGLTFCGYTNIGVSRGPGNTLGSSVLASGDQHNGTTNNDYWQPYNSVSRAYQMRILDNFLPRATSVEGSEIHFVQNYSGGHAAGYATLLILQFLRDNTTTRAKVITMNAKCDAVNHNGDVLYTNTPTATLLDANLSGFSASTQSLGPVELSQTPDTFFLYWPFSNSRLRISAMGFYKAS